MSNAIVSSVFAEYSKFLAGSVYNRKVIPSHKNHSYLTGIAAFDHLVIYQTNVTKTKERITCQFFMYDKVCFADDYFRAWIWIYTNQ